MKRLNIYSKPDILCFINHTLRGSPEFEVIRGSCFGGLFNLPARQCPVSHKLIHSLLTRQIVVSSQHTLWPVVAGHPFRFSLAEFQTVTGLPCGPFPEQYQTSSFNIRNSSKDPLWQKLLGHDSLITVADIGHMLQTEDSMPSDKNPTLQYVQMVDNVDAFLNFPWGRESYLKTINCMIPPHDKEDPIGTLREQLQQTTYRLQGFPLALQLVAFKAIPLLLTKIPAPHSSATLLQLQEPHLPLHNSVTIMDFLLTEADPQLHVTPLIPLAANASSWGEEADDAACCYMQGLIAQNHEFHMNDWPGGDSSLPERISNYFKAKVDAPRPTNEVLLARVEKLDLQVAELQAETRRLKMKLSRRHAKNRAKFSSFKKTLHTPKHRPGSQPLENEVPKPQEHDHTTAQTPTSVQTSPICSQYKDHLFAHSPTSNPLTTHPPMTDSPNTIIQKVILTVNETHGLSPPRTPVGSPHTSESPTTLTTTQHNLVDHTSPAHCIIAHASPTTKTSPLPNPQTPQHTPTNLPPTKQDHLPEVSSAPPRLCCGNLSSLPITPKPNYPTEMGYKHDKPHFITINTLDIRKYVYMYIDKLYLWANWRQFKAASDKDKFRLDNQLRNLVLQPGQTWVSNIHTIYAPMIWGGKHWVGLAINLPLSLVEVLDPLPTLFNDKKVHFILEHVLEMLPLVITQLTTNTASQFDGSRPFTWSRRRDLYINKRGGDYGPLSVKFMEMHANGDPAPHMSGLTNPLVDALRKQYALNIYKSIILPLYLPPPTTTTPQSP
ncbi:hypothetical protein N665_0342s0009 [Sinapis alba]|nr:hypothetical protein N665_0342s0009 [Sinapis alba]